METITSIALFLMVFLLILLFDRLRELMTTMGERFTDDEVIPHNVCLFVCLYVRVHIDVLVFLCVCVCLLLLCLPADTR